jgi:hypothetical protein
MTDRRIKAWRSADDGQSWLSMLVCAMQQSEADDAVSVCKRSELARLRSQLACPASPWPFGGSAYSLRN